MSGHSKWSTIKHKKGAADAKKGKIFSKLIKEITVAARVGGGDPDSNARLRTVVDKARAANMPSDNVTRAIKKGTGDIEGVTYEESVFEGYGPGGVALYIEVLTDNRNRTVAEIRYLLSKGGGNLGETGCVAWMFSKHGVLTFDKDAGAEDMTDDEGMLTVTTDPANFNAVKEACEANGMKPLEAEMTMVPQNTVKLEDKDAEKMLKLMENLEDHEDVQNVSANFDIAADVMEKLA